MYTHWIVLIDNGKAVLGMVGNGNHKIITLHSSIADMAVVSHVSSRHRDPLVRISRHSSLLDELT